MEEGGCWDPRLGSQEFGWLLPLTPTGMGRGGRGVGVGGYNGPMGPGSRVPNQDTIMRSKLHHLAWKTFRLLSVIRALI